MGEIRGTVSRAQAAKMLGLTAPTITKWVQQHKLRANRDGTISRSEVERIQAANRAYLAEHGDRVAVVEALVAEIGQTHGELISEAVAYAKALVEAAEELHLRLDAPPDTNAELRETVEHRLEDIERVVGTIRALNGVRLLIPSLLPTGVDARRFDVAQRVAEGAQ